LKAVAPGGGGDAGLRTFEWDGRGVHQARRACVDSPGLEQPREDNAGAKGKSPIPVLEKYHASITNLYLKDRTADGGTMPWGQGQTAIKEVLQLMRQEKWTFPAEIELEYKIPEGSVAEVAKCVQYCKEALACALQSVSANLNDILAAVSDVPPIVGDEK